MAEAENEGDIRPGVDLAITAGLLFGMVNSLVGWYRPRGGDTHIINAVAEADFDGTRDTPNK